MEITPQEIQTTYDAILNDTRLKWPRIIEFAVRDGYAPDKATARKHLPAFVQWLAVRTIADPDLFIMLSSPLDGVLYHPFMIASTSTFENFRKWYMDGAPFHHEAVLASDPPLNSDYIGDCVKYTVELLEFAFGDRLANELKDWRFALDCGAYAIDGCGGHHCGSHIRQEAA